MRFDLYVWEAPNDTDPARAAGLVADWEAAGGDPAASPFQPTTNVGWFYRELTTDEPELETSTDAVPSGRRGPVWISGSDEPPARVVAIRLPPDTRAAASDTIYSLALKYDLVLFDARSGRVHRPLEEMSAYASATFWPSGAIRSVVALGIGLILVVVGWNLGIPLVGPILLVIGGFLVVLDVVVLVSEGRKALQRRR